MRLERRVEQRNLESNQDRQLMSDIKRGFWLGLLLLLAVATAFAADGATAIERSPRLPDSMPWNLDELSKPPEYTWEDSKGSVRSLFYAGESYQEKPTRVFAYYATPGTLQGDTKLDKDLPAVVLIHGGGGTAFREWAELWAQRGYAAIAMDLAGHVRKRT